MRIRIRQMVFPVAAALLEDTAATPDPAAAKALVQQQYDSLKNGS